MSSVSECQGCTERYPGCKSRCPVGVAEAIENIEKREKHALDNTYKNYFGRHVSRVQTKAWQYYLERERANKAKNGIRTF